MTSTGASSTKQISSSRPSVRALGGKLQRRVLEGIDGGSPPLVKIGALQMGRHSRVPARPTASSRTLLHPVALRRNELADRQGVQLRRHRPMTGKRRIGAMTRWHRSMTGRDATSPHRRSTCYLTERSPGLAPDVRCPRVPTWSLSCEVSGHLSVLDRPSRSPWQDGVLLLAVPKGSAMDELFKGLLTAGTVLLVMAAARHGGRRVAGLVAALPTITAPTLAWLAHDEGMAFAISAAIGQRRRLRDAGGLRAGYARRPLRRRRRRAGLRAGRRDGHGAAGEAASADLSAALMLALGSCAVTFVAMPRLGAEIVSRRRLLHGPPNASTPGTTLGPSPDLTARCGARCGSSPRWRARSP